jgi:hypothetical protein
MDANVSIRRLILIPSVITLAVTLLRLVGELQQWPTALFNRGAGGVGSIVGITWLVFVFGIYFAVKLSAAGEIPPSGARAIVYSIAGIGLMFVSFVLMAPGSKINFPGKLAAGFVLLVLAAVIQFFGWPALAKTLIAYGYAARIPVLIIMYFSIKGNWDTHYSLGPPGVEFPDFWTKFIQIAVIPQMVMWIVFTVVLGSLCGSIVAAVARRKTAAEQPA